MKSSTSRAATGTPREITGSGRARPATPAAGPQGPKNKPKPLNDENFAEIVRSELYKNVKVNGGPTVSAATAITRKLVDLAIGGDMRAMKLALTTLQAADAAEAAQQEAEYNYWMAYVDRLKNDPMRMFYDSRRPVPDPKDIIFDHINKRVLRYGAAKRRGNVRILGGERLPRRDDRRRGGGERERGSRRRMPGRTALPTPVLLDGPRRT